MDFPPWGTVWLETILINLTDIFTSNCIASFFCRGEQRSPVLILVIIQY